MTCLKTVPGIGLEPIRLFLVRGVGAPSLDVEPAPAMGFHSDVKRIPSLGLGCVAGASRK